jgi:CheY-like chemotaxis protein
MSAKRALIVDDSRSARIVLSRMLQKYSIEVDTAESAQSAIDYLVHHRPDVIFMDHLMPGMDGFQAVQAIKNNPRTATIPIMMYTSQEGELYVGQARALGAVGVLPKLVKPVDVSKVLYQLHLLPERRDLAPPAFVAVNLPPAARKDTPEGQAQDLLPADWHQQLEAALRNHDAELRRFVMATLDAQSDRIAGDVRTTLSETPALQTLRPPPKPQPYWWIAGTLAALLVSAVLAGLYVKARESSRLLVAESARLQQANSQLSLAVQRLTQVQTTPQNMRSEEAALGPSSAGALPGAHSAASEGQPRIELVPYGEPPLALGRVDTLREYIAHLQQQPFSGIVRVSVYRGRFCLAGNATEGYALAPPELPLAKCDQMGNPFDEALSPAQRQSLAFANLASSAHLRTGGAINVMVLDDPADNRIAVPYPAATAGVTAGQWNEIAARNNRVEFTAAPAAAAVP